MLSKLLAGTEWSEFAGYISPAFVEAVPPASLAREVGAVARSYLTRRGFRDAKQAVSATALQLGLPVTLVDSPFVAGEEPLSGHARGEAVLQLYFAQLLKLDVALLDFRAASFVSGGAGLIWNPAPLVARWTPEFAEAVRDLYRGFYEDDEQTFRAALGNLGLGAAERELRAHFGADQHALRFRLADFRRSMNKVFTAAVKAGTPVAPEMLTLGIALACLYEHLETLGEVFDVRQAYLSVSRSAGGMV